MERFDRFDLIHSLDLDRYSRIFKTVYQMMRDRGFAPCLGTAPKHRHDSWVSRYTALIARDFRTPIQFVDELTLFFSKGSNVTMVYFFVLDSKFCKDNIKYVYTQMTAKGATSLILVVRNEVTTDVRRALETMGPDNQLFTEDSLTYNVTEHQLVPQHTLLDEAAKRKIKLDYSVEERQLPAMQSTDAIARYYNYKVGDLVRIDRSDGSIYYRIVVP